MTFDPLTAEPTAPELAELRARCPVSRTPSGSWYLSRLDDVTGASRDVEAFVANFRDPGVVVPDEEQLISEIPEPRHGQVRKIINSAIAAHRIGRVEPFCRALCHELLDGLVGREGPVDLLEVLVMPVPNNVIAHLLGAPPEDFRKWARWSDEVVRGTWPAQNRNERGEGLAGAHPEFTGYVDELIAARRAEPRDDFITRLVHTEVGGRRLTDVEARTQLVFLFISGNETTRHLIANLLYRLAADSGLYATLRADPSVIELAVEESLRMDPPVRLLMRNCHRATELHGQRIEVGDKIIFGVSSVNRDESHFEEPHRFRLDRREPRGHFAFGGGPHVCPGASLARLEARIVLEVIAERVAAMRLAPGYRYDNVPVVWAQGPSTLPVELEAA